MPENRYATLPFDGVCRLADWGVIRASGADALSFLQGQLTQDIAAVSSTQARLAGYCSPKGRLLATFVVWRDAADDYLLACSADLLPATLKRLSMFVLRAKCRLSDASLDLPLFGMVGASSRQFDASMAVWASHRHDAAVAIRLPDGQQTPRWLTTFKPDQAWPVLDAGAWSWLEVRSGVPRIAAATADRFVPQMVNLELLDGVNFRKGCYPGQEVVARSQYRGTLKRRTYLVDSSAALLAGEEIMHSADVAQPAGMVVLAASLPGERHCALVELKIAAAQADGKLYAQGRDAVQLTLAELPYSLAAIVD